MTDLITGVILASMDDAVLGLNREGQVVFLNPAASRLLGLAEEAVKGRHYAELFMGDPGNDDFNDVLFSAVQDRRARSHSEVALRRQDGRHLDLGVTASILGPDGAAGAEEGVVVVLHDMTAAKSLDRARERVMDHLSHELKTPLAVLMASVRRLRGAMPSGTWERVERNLLRLQGIQQEVEDILSRRPAKGFLTPRRWLDQVLDLLDLLGTEDPATGDAFRTVRARLARFGQVARPAARLLRPSARAADVLDTARRLAAGRRLDYETRWETTASILMDPGDFDSVLMALIKNAVENTPDGGRVTIAVRQDGGRVQVEVADTGVGITEDSQRQIFGGFYHARATDLYSTKRPFDFGAGGRGLDLLRLTLLGESCGFLTACTSKRCVFVPLETDQCPGSVAACVHVTDAEDCARAGGTTFTLRFAADAGSGVAAGGADDALCGNQTVKG